MLPTTPLDNASVASAIIAPDPLSYLALDEKDASNAKQQDDPIDGNQKPRSNKKAQKQKQQKEPPPTVDERYYAADAEKIEKLRKDRPWIRGDPSSSSSSSGAGAPRVENTTGAAPSRPMAKFFESLSLSPSAVTKIMMHCQSGVEKGISKGGNPIEVMGLMLGRPDPYKPTNLIVTDAFPLPIEGFETRVVADDEDVVNHMISLGERLEGTRREKFMGWYHSHPFDLILGEDARTHCYLSQTDLSTQLQWQRAEDPHGNPFAAVVVDPLLSMHTGTPQLKAFRAYPPEYQSAIPNECPDGNVVASEKQRLELWGSCWNRYYELKVEYYMSEASRSILGDLTQDYLWMKSFQRDPNSGDVVGSAKGTSSSEAAKVGTLRGVAADIRSEVGTEGSRSGTIPLSKSTKIEPLVRKLRETATLALTQQTARDIHAKVFHGYQHHHHHHHHERRIIDMNKTGESKEGATESDAIVTTVTH